MGNRTPGLWRVGDGTIHSIGFKDDAVLVDNPDGSYRTICVLNKLFPNAADAHLIAAAPEMLAACQAMVTDHPAGWPPEMLYDKAKEAVEACRAAVAKATQESA